MRQCKAAKDLKEKKLLLRFRCAVATLVKQGMLYNDAVKMLKSAGMSQ